jgi:hypothetical protein
MTTQTEKTTTIKAINPISVGKWMMIGGVIVAVIGAAILRYFSLSPEEKRALFGQMRTPWGFLGLVGIGVSFILERYRSRMKALSGTHAD